ncbi:MAG: hypothetical protein OJF49_000759 [Ktedonobacterales bacterium]|nr:MAG: hypothetical protein OJF49_000759 [Ktedonobacterales bacterium]
MYYQHVNDIEPREAAVLKLVVMRSRDEGKGGILCVSP